MCVCVCVGGGGGVTVLTPNQILGGHCSSNQSYSHTRRMLHHCGVMYVTYVIPYIQTIYLAACS